MILIGSKAIKHHFPDFKRDAKDTDYIVKHKPDQKFKRVEFLLNPVLDGFSGSILSPNLLYTLKASHLFWDIQWSKHVYDVQFLKSKGCKIDKDIFYQLYQYWCIIHGVNKRSNLDMTAKDFFNNALKKYDHDFLHTLIKPEPTYKKVLKDGAEVDETICPRVFCVRAEYNFGGKCYIEENKIDVRPILQSGVIVDPIAEELKKHNEILLKIKEILQQ